MHRGRGSLVFQGALRFRFNVVGQLQVERGQPAQFGDKLAHIERRASKTDATGCLRIDARGRLAVFGHWVAPSGVHAFEALARRSTHRHAPRADTRACGG